MTAASPLDCLLNISVQERYGSTALASISAFVALSACGRDKQRCSRQSREI
jgi:hypothetical protein